MKFEVRITDDDEKIELQLGLNHVATFKREAEIEDIVVGVQTLIEVVTGVSAFQITEAVLEAQKELYGRLSEVHPQE